MIAAVATYAPLFQKGRSMNIINLHDATSLVALAPQLVRTSTLTGAAVDVSKFEGEMKIIQDAGAASAGTAPTLNGKIQDSADGSTDWQDVAGATFTEVTDAAASLQSIGIQANAVRKFIRYVGTIGGTSTPTFPFGASIVGVKKYVGS